MDGLLTVETLAAQFRALGLDSGHTVIVHASLSKVKDWICGDIQAIIEAFERVLGAGGTLVMPAHSSANSDPADWRHPPVPPEWWPIIREQTPAYQPEMTTTRQMGMLAETFRRYPGTRRSAHPQMSLAARGKHAAYLTADHLLTDSVGETSPYARLLELDAHVLLLGVDHGNNTMLHVAEHRATWPSKQKTARGAAVLINGERRWVTFEDFDDDGSDFEQLGAEYEAKIGYTPGKIGQADSRYLRLRPLIDFAVGWLTVQRTRRAAT
ncbi:MAG: AAC(3) family N-acetyltransferase [Chloroflexi bacterium]|nr:AAC(3) family N-acetyltransferase [Chloroflexota bacterium]